nr:heme o synthase [Halovivax limisalsi]
MSTDHDRSRLVGLLLFSTMATYVLIALGTAASTTGAAESCTTWPGCDSAWTIGPVTDGLALYVGHRLAALIAGLALVWTAWTAVRTGVDRVTGAAIGLAALLFPVQVAIGATLVGQGSNTARTVHLLLAMTIFAGLLVALVRTLEAGSPRDGRANDPSAVAATTENRDPGAVTTDPDATIDAATSAGTESSSEPATGSAGSTSWFERVHRRAWAYVSLTKPRLMWLLCLVAVAGMALASTAGHAVHLGTAVATLAGGVLAIGAAGAFNQVYERDRDERMQRTDDRALVGDRVRARNAYAFVGFLTLASMVVLVTWVNGLAAILTLVAIVYYAIGYTVVLKPHTKWNTVLGGGAGAIPALIGWAAVTGGLDWPAVVLALVIFCWTPAHFYSLAIAYREDYARGGFPMLPVVAGDLIARRHIVGYLGATMLAVSLLGWIAGLGLFYAIASVAFGALFLRSVRRQYADPTTARALRSFYVSNAYLGVVLLAIVVESALAAA